MVLLYDARAGASTMTEVRAAAVSGTTISIRRAEPRDSACLAELSRVLGYPVAPEDMAERLERIAERDTDIVLVAVADDVPVGWIHAGERELLEVPRHAEILGLVVDEGYRRSGVARQLVRDAESWAGERGLDGVVVRSNVVRPESHPFYRALGYSHVKTQHTYRKSLTRA
jgi:GNAT superfamily N-acetyltransferase